MQYKYKCPHGHDIELIEYSRDDHERYNLLVWCKPCGVVYSFCELSEDQIIKVVTIQ